MIYIVGQLYTCSKISIVTTLLLLQKYQYHIYIDLQISTQSIHYSKKNIDNRIIEKEAKILRPISCWRRFSGKALTNQHSTQDPIIHVSHDCLFFCLQMLRRVNYDRFLSSGLCYHNRRYGNNTFFSSICIYWGTNDLSASDVPFYSPFLSQAYHHRNNICCNSQSKYLSNKRCSQKTVLLQTLKSLVFIRKF